MSVILITGAAGLVGSMLRPRLARPGRTLRVLDIAPLTAGPSLTAERPGFRVIFGVSANTRGGWVSLAEAKALGYEPRDDAEVFAAEIIAEHGEPDLADPVLRYLGGPFTLPDDQVPQA